MLITVGNAVLAASYTSESSADNLDYPEGQKFIKDAQSIADAMCVFAADPCGSEGDGGDVEPVLGPDGYGEVRLGMSWEEAVAAGEMTADRVPANASCARGTLNDGGSVDISKKHGVVAIWLGGDMRTAEGIHMGSSKQDVLAAYPDGDHNIHQHWTVPVSDTAEYQVAMPEGVVKEFLLADLKQDCFG